MTVARIEAEPVLNTAGLLGEGPRWSVHNNEHVWVDIEGRCLWRWPAAAPSAYRIDVQGEPSCVFEDDSGHYYLAIDAAVCSLSDALLPAADRTPLVSLPGLDLADARANDGRVDAAGRIWLGTMARDLVTPRAALYRCDPTGPVVVLPQLTISNGIGWSPEGDVMYHVDTPTGIVSRFDFDAASGSVAGRATFAEFTAPGVSPDGLAVDAEGGVWVALWGGGAAYRYDRDGRHTHTITVPEAAHVTALAFGGAGLDQVFLTTAAPGEARQHGSHSGEVFVAAGPFVGIAENVLPAAALRKGGTS